MNRFIILITAVLLMNNLTKLSAQTPITVTVPPMGEKVKLHPLKTGSYEIGFVLSDDVNQITAPGILYVDNKEGVGLKVGISVVLFPEKTKVNVTSMNTIQGTLPGMTPGSLIPRAAKAVGIDYPDLCEEIVQRSCYLKRRG